MSIGENIRKKREKAGITQSELAEQAGITQAMLCWIEQGKRNPSLPSCEKIAHLLGCKISELFSEE